MLRLISSDLHVWPIQLAVSDAQCAPLAGLLSQDEKERAASYRFHNDRRSYTVCRGTLRLLLQLYLGQPAQSFVFTYSAHGKPALQMQTDLRFNVSHSGGLALLAFTRGCELGVDVEAVRPLDDIGPVAQRFFCKAEFEQLMALPPEEQRLAFFRCWTRKEAFIKATGEGLSAELDQFQVAFSAAELPRFIHIHFDSQAAEQWTLQDLPFSSLHSAAVAYRAPAKKIERKHDATLLAKIK